MGRAESGGRASIRWLSAAMLSILLALGCDRSAEPAAGGRASAPSVQTKATPAVSPPSVSVAPTITTESAKWQASTNLPDASEPLASARGSRSAPPRCPVQLPKAGAACDNPAMDCSYVDCKGVGQTSVHCYRGKTILETTPCAAFACGGGAECHGDQICVERQDGSHSTRCIENSCGTKAVSCECAGSVCKADTCSTQGRTVRCGGTCSGCP